MIIALALLKVFILPAVLKLLKNRNQKQDVSIEKEARPQPVNF
ncbi:Uncharacterised protein [Legionella gratiana]|uniref:Uncharacterized protein n=1 Tax=Legionella gratiana TaxID=45066 RepID=A0A378J3V0_9GAMM|nr:hypothetical protein [Legionella gratiana]STX41918.1 Uncharacterised protein [Legionella gratiana]